MSGENPLRWDCAQRGCFNQKKRPKIEEFAHLFPRKIAMGDVDGMVELNGHFLFLEWKPSPVELSTGQKIAYARLTSLAVDDAVMVYVVAGDASEMRVEAVKRFQNGRESEWKQRNKEQLFASLSKWVEYVQKRPRPSFVLADLQRRAEARKAAAKEPQ